MKGIPKTSGGSFDVGIVHQKSKKQYS